MNDYGKRAIIWARVSTKDQETDNQLPELLEWAERRGLDVVETITLDAVSGYGGKAHDQAIDDLVGKAHRREFDVLLMVAIDRLTRKGVDDTLLTLNRLGAAGVHVLALRDDWTGAPREFQPMIIAIYSTFANIAHKNRSDHTKAGMAKAKRRGVKLGPHTIASDGVDVALVLNLREEGMSWAKCQAAHPATVRDAKTGPKLPPSVTTIRRAMAERS